MASSARIDELQKKFDENPRRYFAPLANEYRKAGDIERAISICREYLPQQPGHMSGHIVYGQALYEARQFDEAKGVFETALSLDPENLIALRHLGDIALIIGDTDGARGWYRRVLEADPRNEEIQAQLATLDNAGAAPVAAAPTPTVTPAVPASAPAPAAAPVQPWAAAAKQATKPTPSSAPTVVVSAVKAAQAPPPPAPAPQPAAPPPAGPQSAPAVTVAEVPATRPPVTPESPTAEVLLDTVVPAAPAPAPPVSPPRAESLELASAVPGVSASDVPPLDSFSLEGLETTSLAAPAAPAPAAATARPAAAAPTPVSVDLPELDLDMPAPTPAAVSAPAVPAAPPAPPAPVAAAPVPDLEFAEPDSSAPAASPIADLPMLDLGDAGTPAAPPVPPAAPAPPALEEMSLAAETPPPVAAPDSGPFVTETMAELYLQQGHRQEALRVYRALVEQRPGDASLRAKVSALESEMAPQPAAQRAPAARREVPPPFPKPAARPQPPAPPRAGPTIREVLSLVATRRPGFRPEVPQQNGAPAEAPPISSADAISRRVASLGPDVIGGLFGNARISPADEGAAMALALAFVEMNGGQSAPAEPASRGITGAPARPAATELSLDSVFGTNQATHAAPSSFSFDQFFSARATSEHAVSSEPSGGERSATQSDVAQFTQWLEGLKQR